MVYHALLNDKITCEQNGTDFFCPSEDRRLLHKMFDEINHQTGSDIHYLAQIDSFIIPGAGRIVEKYILDFTSESVKCYLIPQMIADYCNYIYILGNLRNTFPNPGSLRLRIFTLGTIMLSRR